MLISKVAQNYLCIIEYVNSVVKSQFVSLSSVSIRKKHQKKLFLKRNAGGIFTFSRNSAFPQKLLLFQYFLCSSSLVCTRPFISWILTCCDGVLFYRPSPLFSRYILFLCLHQNKINSLSTFLPNIA